MADDGQRHAPNQEDQFFESANAEFDALGKRQFARRVVLMAAMLALTLGGGIGVAWAIIAASR